MRYLRRFWPALLLALLTACGGASSATATPETAATAETAHSWTVGEMEPINNAGPKGYYRTRYQAWGQDNVEYGYNLLTRLDYDTLEMEVVCRKPGCEHDSPDCLAYSNIQNNDYFIAQDDGSVLVYHRAFSENTLQDMLDAYREILNDPDRLAEEYPGEVGAAYVQDCVNMLQQPSYVDRISADGTSRERLFSLPEGINPQLVCRDENALYGVIQEGTLDLSTTNYGVRIGLDGQVDTFDIPDPEYTNLIGGWNGRLVLRHTRSPVDMNTMFLYGNYDGFYALERQATQDCWLYDPVTGETDKIRLPDEQVELMSMVGDMLVYCRSGDTGDALCIYDLMTGESSTLYEENNRINVVSPVCNLAGTPHFVTGYMNGSSTMVELSTGICWNMETLEEMTGLSGQGYHVNAPVCETADGRLLLELYNNNSRYPSYTTIPSPVTPEDDVADVRASLQAVQEYQEEKAVQEYQEEKAP